MNYYSTKISASILSANFLNLGSEISSIEAAGVDALHLDVMDNHLAPNVSFGPPIISAVATIATVPLDVHLMIDAPWLFFDDYIQAGATDICFHVECYDAGSASHTNIKTTSRVATSVDGTAILRDIHYLKDKGIRAGLTVNPLTDVSIICPFLHALDYILLMSVHPGFSGQSFIQETLAKISDTRAQFDGDIHVDGGVNNTNAEAVVQAGANGLISASYLFASANYSEAVQSLRINP